MVLLFPNTVFGMDLLGDLSFLPQDFSAQNFILCKSGMLLLAMKQFL
jgi:hypothetical protein